DVLGVLRCLVRLAVLQSDGHTPDSDVGRRQLLEPRVAGDAGGGDVGFSEMRVDVIGTAKSSCRQGGVQVQHAVPGERAIIRRAGYIAGYLGGCVGGNAERLAPRTAG